MSVGAQFSAVDGVELPAPGVWQLDKAHTTVGFTAKHLRFAKVRGRFQDFDASIHIAERPEDSWVEATINAASIDTADETRDNHLRSADFLDVENYPTLTFRSTGLKATGSNTFELTGDLTIRSVTRPVTLQVEFGGLVKDPWGRPHAIFSATT